MTSNDTGSNDTGSNDTGSNDTSSNDAYPQQASKESYELFVRGEVTASEEGLARLREDERLAELVDRFGPYSWTLHTPFFATARAIVGQRISGRSAQTTFRRLMQVTGLEPERVLAASDDELRNAGLPKSKVRYLREVATVAQDGGLDDLFALSDDDAKDVLTEITGVGPWTAEMVLMFSLGRCDVWPVGDLGVVQAAEGIYDVDKKGLGALGERFRPYRSAATWYFWRWSEAR